MTEHANETNATDETAQGRLLGAADIRRIAAEAGISPTKKFGQNFVIDPGTVRRIVREAGVTADDHVLEVGPGLGSLTLAILETGATMTAVEIDPPVAERLPGTIAEFMPDAVDRFRVVNRDALTVTPENLPDFQNDDSFTLVANLPYNVATPILLTLLERFDNLGTFLVMVQKEVADRLSEKPGSKIYGTPSVKLAWYGTAERVGIIGRNVFWPAPNVDSALVLFKRYEGGHTPSANNPDGSVVDRENVFRLIDAAFGQRRKTLHAALKKIVPSEAFEQAGIDPTRRGETLAIDEFVEPWARCRKHERHQHRNQHGQRGLPGENESDPARRQATQRMGWPTRARHHLLRRRRVRHRHHQSQKARIRFLPES